MQCKLLAVSAGPGAEPYVAGDVLHGVIDGHASRDGASRGVDCEGRVGSGKRDEEEERDKEKGKGKQQQQPGRERGGPSVLAIRRFL